MRIASKIILLALAVAVPALAQQPAGPRTLKMQSS
jgi:hypothetical protein